MRRTGRRGKRGKGRIKWGGMRGRQKERESRREERREKRKNNRNYIKQEGISEETRGMKEKSERKGNGKKEGQWKGERRE